MKPDLRGQTALVTGASGGLGQAFAARLAELGADLVLSARRADRLERLATDLSARTGVRAVALPVDLAEEGAARTLFDRTEGHGTRIDLLINNAGFGDFAAFTELSFERVRGMLQVDVVALTELTWLFGRAMAERGLGAILNVGSFAGFLPVPYCATYAAGKAYVNHFSAALSHELGPQGVRVLSLCPGAVDTDFWQSAGEDRPIWVLRATMARPEAVARKGLRALLRGRHTRLFGAANHLGAICLRLLPERFVSALIARILRRRFAARAGR